MLANDSLFSQKECPDLQSYLNSRIYRVISTAPLHPAPLHSAPLPENLQEV